MIKELPRQLMMIMITMMGLRHQRRWNTVLWWTFHIHHQYQKDCGSKIKVAIFLDGLSSMPHYQPILHVSIEQIKTCIVFYYQSQHQR